MTRCNLKKKKNQNTRVHKLQMTKRYNVCNEINVKYNEAVYRH